MSRYSDEAADAFQALVNLTHLEQEARDIKARLQHALGEIDSALGRIGCERSDAIHRIEQLAEEAAPDTTIQVGLNVVHSTCDAVIRDVREVLQKAGDL